MSGRRIAVIGGGISGLTAGYVLSRTDQVTLFEADRRLGGHADTHLFGPVGFEQGDPIGPGQDVARGQPADAAADDGDPAPGHVRARTWLVTLIRRWPAPGWPG